jgi:ribosomal protein S18 acetylase RimI-like enzyme
MGAPQHGALFICQAIRKRMDDRSSVYLRAAERGDAWALARLRSASLLEQELLAASEARAFERRAFREFSTLFADEGLAAWVLVAAGRVAGAACVVFWRRLPYREGSLHAELCGVYVEPALRRRGFARELCSEALASARAADVRKIVVHASDVGRPLYEQLGFIAGNEMRLDLCAPRATSGIAVARSLAAIPRNRAATSS